MNLSVSPVLSGLMKTFQLNLFYLLLFGYLFRCRPLQLASAILENGCHGKAIFSGFTGYDKEDDWECGNCSFCLSTAPEWPQGPVEDD